MVKSWTWTVVCVLVGVAGTLAYQARGWGLLDRWLGRSSAASTIQAAVAEPILPSAPSTVQTLGTLEPRSGVVQVASPLVGLRIVAVHARAGAPVQTDDVLLELDDQVAAAELALAKLQLADAEQKQQAEIETARRRLQAAALAAQQARDGQQIELDLQQLRIDAAREQHAQAGRDLARLQALRAAADPLASAQQVEQQTLLVQSSRSEVRAAEAALQQLTQTLQFKIEQTETERGAADSALKLAEAHRAADSLREQVRLAELKLAQTKVRAPCAGVVVNCFVEPGEIVSQQPLVQLANVADMVCRVEVDTADLQYLRRDQPARVFSRAFRGAYRQTHVEGRLIELGNLIARAAIQPRDPRQPLDRHVIEAVVAVDCDQVLAHVNPDLAPATGQPCLHALIGMQVEVEFRAPPEAATASPPRRPDGEP